MARARGCSHFMAGDTERRDCVLTCTLPACSLCGETSQAARVGGGHGVVGGEEPGPGSAVVAGSLGAFLRRGLRRSPGGRPRCGHLTDGPGRGRGSAAHLRNSQGRSLQWLGLLRRRASCRGRSRRGFWAAGRARAATGGYFPRN